MKNASPLADTLKSMTTSLAPMSSSRALAAGLRPAVSIFARRIAFSLLLLGASLSFVQPCAGTLFQWEFTGSLNTARYHHIAALLPDGMVLVAAGFDGSQDSSAELYDPASGAWSVTGSLNVGRVSPTATLLPNGLVLVAGGSDSGGTATNTAELYDPASGTWRATGNLNVARHNHMATSLQNGMVLVAGGLDDVNHIQRSAELYDPLTETWTVTGSLNTGRWDLAAAPSTLLPNGTVLVEGGFGRLSMPLASAEVYDLASGTWSVTGNLNTARGDHTATLLPNGMVLVAGGEDSNFDATADAELYDPATGTWTPTGSLIEAHTSHTATLLPNGMVLLASGFSFDDYTTDAELYDPATGTWSVTGSLNAARTEFTATLLPSGMVLVAAGNFGDTVLNSAELYDPGIAITLSARGRKINGVNTVRLTWSGAISPNTDVYRDGVVIATVPNTGTYTDSTGTTGRARFAYKVCKAGTQTCSNEVTVKFRP
jgi:hypothetical protein